MHQCSEGTAKGMGTATRWTHAPTKEMSIDAPWQSPSWDLDETYMKNSPFTGPRFLFERREDVASDGGAAESSGTSEERRYVGMLMDRRGA